MVLKHYLGMRRPLFAKLEAKTLLFRRARIKMSRNLSLAPSTLVNTPGAHKSTRLKERFPGEFFESTACRKKMRRKDALSYVFLSTDIGLCDDSG